MCVILGQKCGNNRFVRQQKPTGLTNEHYQEKERSSLKSWQLPPRESALVYQARSQVSLYYVSNLGIVVHIFDDREDAFNAAYALGPDATVEQDGKVYEWCFGSFRLRSETKHIWTVDEIMAREG